MIVSDYERVSFDVLVSEPELHLESLKEHAAALFAACWAALDEDSGLACAEQLRDALLAASGL